MIHTAPRQLTVLRDAVALLKTGRAGEALAMLNTMVGELETSIAKVAAAAHDVPSPAPRPAHYKPRPARPVRPAPPKPVKVSDRDYLRMALLDPARASWPASCSGLASMTSTRSRSVGSACREARGVF